MTSSSNLRTHAKDGPLAQLAEHGANNTRVMNSSLIRTKYLFLFTYYLLVCLLAQFEAILRS